MKKNMIEKMIENKDEEDDIENKDEDKLND